MPETFDAVVIGGGPGGAMSALLLARRGWRTALIERGARNRIKACGHCLSPRANALLDRAGLAAAATALSVGAVSRVRVHHAEARRPLELAIGSGRGGSGLVIERSRLDQMLIDEAAAAGVEVLQPASARVESIDSAAARIRVEATSPRVLEAALLIGADGVNSAVARAAGLCAPAERLGRKYGFSFDVSAPCPFEHDAIEMFVVDGGYLGVVAQSARRAQPRCELHVGGLVGASPTAEPRAPIRFVRAVARRFEPLRAAMLHQLDEGRVRRFGAAGPMPATPEAVAGGRVVLVGDAAGYAEPFTGEGMTWALEGAEALDDVVAGMDPGRWSGEAARGYERAWARRVAGRHRFCRLVAAGLERRWTASLMLGPGPFRAAVAKLVVRRLVA